VEYFVLYAVHINNMLQAAVGFLSSHCASLESCLYRYMMLKCHVNFKLTGRGITDGGRRITAIVLFIKDCLM
jgi:hypothetical protein